MIRDSDLGGLNQCWKFPQNISRHQIWQVLKVISPGAAKE